MHDSSPPADEASPNRSGGLNRSQIIRWVCILVIVVALIFIIRSLPLEQMVSVVRDWITGLGVWGPLALALLYIVATVLFVPGTILTLLAGALFGLWVGLATVSVASTIGAAFAFLIARYVAREKVRGMARRSPRFGAMDRAIGEGGWKIVALLRLSPAIPFNAQNYLYGLTPIGFWPYVLTSWIAMLPGTFLYVYLGHVTGVAVGAERERTAAEWAMLSVGLVATIVVTVYVTWLARRTLREQVDSPEVIDKGASADGTSSGEPRSGKPGVGKYALAAIGMVILAVLAQMQSESIASWFSSAFGSSS